VGGYPSEAGEDRRRFCLAGSQLGFYESGALHGHLTLQSRGRKHLHLGAEIGCLKNGNAGVPSFACFLELIEIVRSTLFLLFIRA